MVSVVCSVLQKWQWLRSSVTGVLLPLGWQKPCRSPRRAFGFFGLILLGFHSLFSTGQEDPKFVSSLDYVARLCFNNRNYSLKPQMSVCCSVKPGKGTANLEAGEIDVLSVPLSCMQISIL